MLFKRKPKQQDDPRAVSVGPAGERLAAEYLTARGYKIAASNFRTKFGEIDLVCLDGDVVVFVEVKTRTSGRYGRPVEAVSPEKQRRLSMAAGIFLSREAWDDRRARFDVLGVSVVGDAVEIEHLPDAFDQAQI